jgi:flagellar motor protein MotB
VALAPKDESDARRAEAAVKAIVDGGAPAARVKSELAGARAPVVDPQDARLRARNERVDVVFVTGG